MANEIPAVQILDEGGSARIIAVLKEYYQPHLEQALPRAFERAVYGDARKQTESLGEYILRAAASFRELQG